MLGIRRKGAGKPDPYATNRAEIAKTNAYLLKRITWCAALNMIVLSALCPFLAGFRSAAPLYYASAAATTLFGLYCLVFLDRCPRAVLPLYYLFLGGLCAYAVALSSFYYPELPGVTIIGIFMLVPMVILDKTWRVNLIFFLYYIASCLCAFWGKSTALATDDAVTCGCFMVFGMLIGNNLRTARLRVIVQRQQLAYQRDMDDLTGLPNRRNLFATLARTPVSGVIMLDIDYFKRYNDQHGHQAGDDRLRAFGAFLRRFAEQNGVRVFRYGGEEFIVLCYEKNGEQLRDLARGVVATVRAEGDDGLTVSAGYAHRGDTSVDDERLISRADTALYAAKDRGRDRAEGWESVRESD